MYEVDTNHFGSPHKNWNQGSLWIIRHLKDAANDLLRSITNLMDLVKCSSTVVNFSIPVERVFRQSISQLWKIQTVAVEANLDIF